MKCISIEEYILLIIIYYLFLYNLAWLSQVYRWWALKFREVQMELTEGGRTRIWTWVYLNPKSTFFATVLPVLDCLLSARDQIWNQGPWFDSPYHCVAPHCFSKSLSFLVLWGVLFFEDSQLFFFIYMEYNHLRDVIWSQNFHASFRPSFCNMYHYGTGFL